MPATPTALSLTKLAATLDGFTMQGKTPAKYTLSTSLSRGGDVTAAGSFNLAEKQVESKLTVAALALPALQPYLGEATRARVLDGTLGATVNAKADWGKTPLAAQVADSTVSLKSLKIATPDAKAPAIVLPDASAKIAKVDVATRIAEIASVDVSAALDVQRLKDGKIDLASLAEPAQAAVPKRTVARKAEAAAPSWHYRIDALNVKDSAANFTDLSTPRPVKLAIKPLDLSVQKISDDLTAAARATEGDAEPQGFVERDGRRDRAAAEARPEGQRQPSRRGRVRAVFRQRAERDDRQCAAQRAGQPDVRAGEGRAARDLSRRCCAGRRADARQGDLRPVRGLALARTDEPEGELRREGHRRRCRARDVLELLRPRAARRAGAFEPEGRGREGNGAQSLTRDASKGEPVPLSPGMTPPAAAQAASAAAAQQASVPAAASATVVVKAAPPPQNPVRMHFGELLLQNGRVTYTDNFIKPNYTANLVAIKGTVGAFGTDSTTSAPVDVAANLAGNGPISIKGSVNPLTEKPALDLTATAHDIELTNLTPYSAKYAGYPITKGKLNVDLHYELANDQLKANNHIFIDQLTFGDHVENDTATRLPVKLAISLLKNTRGQIDVNLPVSAAVESGVQRRRADLARGAEPDREGRHVAVLAARACVRRRRRGSRLRRIRAGPYQLDDAQQKKLDTVVKMLTEKPSIRLDLIGRVDPARDTSLGDAYVDRLVRQQKLRDVVGQGESIDPMSVKVEPAEYSKYLTRAYKAADFKKPRNVIGLQKTLPDADMKKALADHAPADDNALRALAQQRAQAVRQYLDGKIDSSRVFVVAPKLDAKGIEDKGATTRVDFGLQ